MKPSTKLAGLALLGVAGVALILGVITLFTGNGNAANNNTSQPPTVPVSSAPSTPAKTTTAVPTTTAPPATTTTTVAPPPTTAPPGGPGVKSVPVRVYNNSTITGLAARAADDLRRHGWNVVETGNYAQGIIPTTTVYFRPGTEEEPSAAALASEFEIHSDARFQGIAGAHPGLIVIVTNDYQAVK